LIIIAAMTAIERPGMGKFYRMSIKVLSVVLLGVIGALVAYTADVAFWIDSHLIHENAVADTRKAINVAPYVYGETPPAMLGEIKNPKNAYVHIKLRFRADNTEGFPNLFQTAPVNRGMRMEISGSTAAIIVPDLAVPDKLRGLTLTTSLKTGQWYALEVEALNGSFIRVLLDGRLVANHTDPEISMETTQLLLGGGFDPSRVFRGKMDNISITIGNFYLPHHSLEVVYVALIVFSALFFFTLWKALGENSAVQSLAGKLALLTFPLILILAYSEYRLSFLNTVYYAKRVALEQQIDKIEVLVMGSSNTVYGVAPEGFSHPGGFNLAFPGNGMFFDASLVEKYTGRMPHLRKVVLTVNYFTMGLDYSTFSQSWRQFFLRQNFNILIQPTAGLSFDSGFWVNPRNFSRIALYGDRAGSYISANHRPPVDIVTSLLDRVIRGVAIPVNMFATPSGWFDGEDASLVDIITTPSGWLDGGDVAGNEQTQKLGVAAAEAHNASADVGSYDRNLGYWEGMMDFLQRKNIDSVIVLLPTDISYYSHLDKLKVALMNRKLTEFANRHHIKFVDYTGDPRFSLSDFTTVLPDHMNARGAMKFSKILDEEVIKAQ
jgi:hypothetical protein